MWTSRLVAATVLAAAPAIMGSNNSVSQSRSVTLQAKAVDSRGRPVSGARLEPFFHKAKQPTRSGPDGMTRLCLPWPFERLPVPAPFNAPFNAPFEWMRIPDGYLLLRVMAPGFASRILQIRVHDPGVIQLGTFKLPPGGTVEGRVVDERGKPVKDAWVVPREPVIMTPTASLRAFGSFAKLHDFDFPAFTDADGDYRIEGVPATFVSVMAKTGDTFYGYSKPVAVCAAEVSKVEDIVLARADAEHRISGTVLGLDGKPLAGIPISAATADVNFSGTRKWSDAEGRFELIVALGRKYSINVNSRSLRKAVSPGETDLVVQVDAHILDSLAASRSLFDPSPDAGGEETATAADSLNSQCLLNGRLLFGGDPPVGWTCSLGRRDLRGLKTVRVDSKGHFELPAPKPGRYWITFFQNSAVDSLSQITGTVELHLGSNSWSLDISVGGMRIENLETIPYPEERTSRRGNGPEIGYELRWQGNSGMEWVFNKPAGQDTTWELPVVPSGALKLLRFAPPPEPRSSSWREGIAIHLKAGEKRRIRLP